MRALLVSDLHLEFHNDFGESFIKTLSKDCDLVFLAGDITISNYIPHTLQMFAKHFKKQQVLYVHGNHDYYKSSIDKTIGVTKHAIKHFKLDNIHHLSNDIFTFNGQRILGTTLWFDEEVHAPTWGMSDFGQIENSHIDIYEANKKSVSFLTKEMKENDVVITHHLPSEICIAWEYRDSPLNPFFVHPLDNLIINRKPKLFHFGHTHVSFDDTLGVTRLVCNPCGYYGYELNKYFEQKIIEI